MSNKIAIVFGGESCEHDISVITALSVYHAVKWDYRCFLVYMRGGKFFIGEKLSDISSYVDFNLNKLTQVYFQNGFLIEKRKHSEKKTAVDCAVLCNHGGNGENGALSGYMEIARVPYSACGVLSSAVCMDKVFTKYLLEKFRYPTVPYKVYKKGDGGDTLAELGFPLIIKPANLGSSIGITIADTAESLKESLKLGLMFDDKLLVEKALTDFTEYNCAVCRAGGEIICSEIERPLSSRGFLNFHDKYISQDNSRELPAKIDAKLKEKITALCRKLYNDFEMKGVVRIDFLYKDKLYVNEINTLPGSLSAYLFKAKGIDPPALIGYLIDDAIAAFVNQERKVTDFTSSVLSNFSAESLKCGVKK